MNTRRQFLRNALSSSALVSLAPAVPPVLLGASAKAAQRRGDEVLVVLQLSGGNDGLNTVVPYGHSAYYKNRFTLAVGKGQVLKIDDEIGFHPSLTGFSDLLEKGQLSVVQGVGYPNPNRSHFASMDIWHTAVEQPVTRTEGWLGRALPGLGAADSRDVRALHLGGGVQPRALSSLTHPVPSVQTLDGFRLQGGDEPGLRNSVEAAAGAARPGASDLLGFLQASTRAALTSSRQVQEVIGKYESGVDYPGSDLARKLRSVAQLVDSGASTRIYYVTIGSFDTHSQQANAHAALLKELGDAVSAFLRDLAQHGHGERVLLLSFSEFGRRVKENASRGTDHGTAAPMFLAGAGVKPGAIGAHPDLENLVDGDLRHHTDFRSVYADVLRSWLGVDPAGVLGRTFKPAGVVRAAG